MTKFSPQISLAGRHINFWLTNPNHSVESKSRGADMSRIDVTTQELFLRLGDTSQSRSTRADAVFRRLRSAEHDQLTSDISAAPKQISVGAAPTTFTPKALRQL
jgi:hypothetical protein